MTAITAIYPGTFDPITLGHMDLIKRAQGLFHHVIVAVAANPKKNPIFSIKQRKDLVEKVIKEQTNVSVITFDNLLVEQAQTQQAQVILRGLRAISDFEHEFQMAGINRTLNKNIETLHLMPAEKYTYLSSSMVREIASLNGDISAFVHPTVEKALQAYYMHQKC